MQELKSMVPRTSQYHPGHEIPEKNWYYRIAKKFLFNDFGVYKGKDHSKSAAPYLTGTAPGTPGAGNAKGSVGCCSNGSVEEAEAKLVQLG